MIAITMALLAASGAGGGTDVPTERTPAAIRLIDLNGDGLLDRLQWSADGQLTVALNQGRRQFEIVVQDLPPVHAVDALAADLNHDTRTDLYLVSSGDNVALVGDGTGRFTDGTLELGLADPGVGRSAELVDIDADGTADLVLHNESGDVLFWGAEAGTFERDPSTPLTEGTLATPTLAGIDPAEADGSGGANAGKLAQPAHDAEPASAGTRTVVVPGSSSSKSGKTAEGGLPPPTEEVLIIPTCVKQIEDVTTSTCITANSLPTLGSLYPLGPEFSITPGGLVGINDTTPQHTLDVNGDFRAVGSFGFTPCLVHTGFSTLILASHTGAGSPVTFELREDSTTTNNLSDYGMFELVRTNVSADGSGAAMYLRMPDFFGTEVEWAGVGARIESGLTAGVARNGALDFYTTDSGLTRYRHMTLNAQGELDLFLGDGVTNNISLDPDFPGSDAVFTMTDNAEVPRFQAESDPTSGGELFVFANDGGYAAALDGDGGDGGGLLVVNNDLQELTVAIDGDYNTDSGRVVIYDRSSTSNIASIEANGEDVFGSGGELLMRNGAGNVTVDFDLSSGGSPTQTSAFQMNESDGSLALQFSGSLFRLFNNAGSTTISDNRVTGTKSGVVQTESHGQRLFYTMESPEVWFEDFGRGRLRNGTARIDLDPIFLESVTVTDQHPLQVYVTMTGESQPVWVEQGRTHFVVHESAGGKSDATFNWRVVAKRKGLEDTRLEELDEVMALEVHEDPVQPYHASPEVVGAAEPPEMSTREAPPYVEGVQQVSGPGQAGEAQEM